MINKSIDYNLKNPWEIEKENKTSFLRKFVIYDDSNLIQSRVFSK